MIFFFVFIIMFEMKKGGDVVFIYNNENLKVIMNFFKLMINSFLVI